MIPEVQILRVDPVQCSIEDLGPAVAWLRQGGVVVMPTDTAYGLAVDIRNDAAVRTTDLSYFSRRAGGRSSGVPCA